jgi:hypothetical protein
MDQGEHRAGRERNRPAATVDDPFCDISAEVDPALQPAFQPDQLGLGQ